MKVLIICSGNPKNGPFNFEIDQAFIYDQIKAIKKMGVFYCWKGIQEVPR